MENVVLQAIEIFHSDLDVVVDKSSTLEARMPRSAIIMASRQPNKEVNIRNAQRA